MSDCKATIESMPLPSAVAGLVANGGVAGVNLGWDANAVQEQVTSYKVYRAPARGGPFTYLGSTASTTYSDTTAVSNTLYWYRVTAVNAGGEGPYSDVSGSFLADVTAPSNVTITSTTLVGATAVKLTWTSPTDADLAGFNVYARIAPAAYAKLNTSGLVSALEYIHSAATAGNTWSYKVTSVDQTGNESVGVTSSIAVPASDTTAPATPATPVAANESGGIRLTWTPNTESDLANYKIYRSSDGFVTAIATQSSALGGSYLDASAVVGNSYSYKVTALDGTGNESTKSVVSNTVLRATVGSTSLDAFIKAGAMVPTVIHARGVGLYTYDSPSGAPITSATEDFTALAAGTVLTAKYDWNMAAGLNEPQGKYPQLRGFNAAHAYDSAGTYTVKLTRTDETGKIEVYQSTVTLAADTRRKVYCSSDGTGDGSSSSTPCNPSKANSLLATTANLKVVLRTGDSYWFATGGFRLTKSNQTITTEAGFAKSGSTVKPVVGYNAANSGGRNLIYVESGATNAVVENITLDSNYTGDGLKKSYGIRVFGAVNILIRNIDVNKFGSLVECSDVKSARYILVQDCRCIGGNKSLKNSIMYIKADDVVILGCQMPNSRDEHCIRWASSCRTLVAYCDLTNMQYNAAASPWKDLDTTDTVKTVLDIQQGYHHYVFGNKLACSLYKQETAGTVQIGPLNETTGHVGEFVQYIVFERNTVSQASIDIQPGCSYVMVRNNIITKDAGYAFEVDQKGSGTDSEGVSYAGRTAHHVYLYNNTVFNNSPSGQLLRMKDLAVSLEVQNNLFIGANLTQVGTNDTQCACARLGNTDTTNCTNKYNVYPTFNKFLVGGSNTFESVTNWNKRTNFIGNQSLAVVLNSLYKVPTASAAKTLAQPIKGVFEDYYGTARSQTAPSWVCGAVEGSY